MAKPYPIVPASVLDELHDLNCSLMAYQYAIEGFIRRVAEEGTPTDLENLIAGLDNIGKPILEGYQSIHSSVQTFREMGVVGFCTLDETAPQNR